MLYHWCGPDLHGSGAGLLMWGARSMPDDIALLQFGLNPLQLRSEFPDQEIEEKH